MIDVKEKDIESVKEVLRLGKGTPFWKLVCKALDESINHLQNEQDGESIKELPADQYKLEAELLKAKRKYLAHLKNLPETLIAYLSEPEANTGKAEKFDPYYTESELSELK